jgi:hypothetical protein
MSQRVLAGKWLSDAVPKLGWSGVGMVDLRACEPRAQTEICQMCEARHIRYVHILQHGAWPEPLRVGFTCAERMEGNPGEARRRLRQIRAAAKRLERWVSTGWATVSNERGVTVTQRDCGDWRIEVVSCGKYCLLHLRHLASDRVVATKRAQSLILAKYDSWDLWHEGEAIRTAYLANVAAEGKARWDAEQAQHKRLEQEEAARRAEEWERTLPEREIREAANAAECQAQRGFIVASGVGWALRVHKRGTIYVSRMDWGLRIESELVGDLQVYAGTELTREIGAENCSFLNHEDGAYTFGTTRAEAEVAAVPIVPRVPPFIQAAWIEKWRTSKKGNAYMLYGEWRLVVVPASTGAGARLLMTHVMTNTDLTPWPYQSQREAQLGAMSMIVKAPQLLEAALRGRRQ